MEVNHRRNGKKYQSYVKRDRFASCWLFGDFLDSYTKKQTKKLRRRRLLRALREEIYNVA